MLLTCSYSKVTCKSPPGSSLPVGHRGQDPWRGWKQLGKILCCCWISSCSVLGKAIGFGSCRRFRWMLSFRSSVCMCVWICGFYPAVFSRVFPVARRELTLGREGGVRNSLKLLGNLTSPKEQTLVPEEAVDPHTILKRIWRIDMLWCWAFTYWKQIKYIKAVVSIATRFYFAQLHIVFCLHAMYGNKIPHVSKTAELWLLWSVCIHTYMNLVYKCFTGRIVICILVLHWVNTYQFVLTCITPLHDNVFSIEW